MVPYFTSSLHPRQDDRSSDNTTSQNGIVYQWCGHALVRLCNDLVWPLGHCIVGGLRHEAECALTANHQALDDLDGVLQREVDQRVEGVACCALDGELALDERCKLRVFPDPLGQVEHTFYEVCVALHKAECVSMQLYTLYS